MKYKIFIFSLLLFFSSAKSQAPNILWQRAFGGSNNDMADSVAQTSDGGFIIAGTSASTQGNLTINYGGNDVWIVKTNGMGILQWQKSFGGSGDDQAKSIITTADGGYIIAGTTSSSNGHITQNKGSYDYWAIKLDINGNIQWQKTYGGNGNDQAHCIRQTSEGGYIIAGFSSSTSGDITNPHGDRDFWIVKTDNSGNLTWQKSLGGSSSDTAWEIQQLKDGGYIVAGDSSSSDGDHSTVNFGAADVWVVKLTSSGNISWEKRLGGSANDFGTSVKQTLDNGFIVAGYTHSQNGHIASNNGGSDFWIIKLDTQGNITWENTFGGIGNENARSVFQASDGKYVASGWTVSHGGDVSGNNGAVDYWVIKINSDGNLLWQKCLGGDNQDLSSQIIQTTDGGAVIVGESNTFNNGQVSGSFGSKDFWVVKLDNVLTTDEVFSKNKISVYPNPAKDFIYIENLPNNSTITITDISGRKIFSEKYSDSKISIDVSHYNPGMYVLQAEHQGKQVLSHKIIISK